MNSATWVALLQRIPPNQHHNLMVVTSVGIEISLQGLIRVEEEYMVIRGRLAGTTDTGRVFFIPYDQINYLGFIKAVKEADVQALFGGPVPAAAAAETMSLAEEAPAPEATQPDETVLPVEAEPKAPPLPGKAALLERLRSRIKANASKPPPDA